MDERKNEIRKEGRKEGTNQRKKELISQPTNEIILYDSDCISSTGNVSLAGASKTITSLRIPLTEIVS